MKINPSVGFEHYQKYVKSLKKSEPSPRLVQDGGKFPVLDAPPVNADKVSFSENAAALSEISRETTMASAEIDSLGNAQRLAQIRQEIQEGTYSVSSHELADAILGYARY